MRGRWAVTACLLGLTVLSSGRVAAQEPKGSIDTRVVLENDEVTVALLTFPPGSASGNHVGLETEMGIVVEGELTLETPSGREVLGPGAVKWLPALTPHDARNEGTTPLKLWVVLFKRSR